MTGKQKCAILKEIRRDIAAKNDISIRIEECTHRGECRGTCPRCESEVRILERALEEKKKRGLQTAIAGVSAGILAASLASCVPVSGEQIAGNGGSSSGITDLAGDVMPTDETVGIDVTEGEAAYDPDSCGDGTEDAAAADTVPDRDAEDIVLEGEPPVEDYLHYFIDEYMDENGKPVVLEGLIEADDVMEEAAP